MKEERERDGEREMERDRDRDIREMKRERENDEEISRLSVVTTSLSGATEQNWSAVTVHGRLLGGGTGGIRSNSVHTRPHGQA